MFGLRARAALVEACTAFLPLSLAVFGVLDCVKVCPRRRALSIGGACNRLQPARYVGAVGVYDCGRWRLTASGLVEVGAHVDAALPGALERVARP